MGLSIFVGILTDLDDDETIADYRADFAEVTRALEAAGFPQWNEPDVDPAETFDSQMYGYDGLHYLRRLAVHVAASGMLPPPGDEDAIDDSLLEEVYRGRPSHAVTVSGTVTVAGAPNGSFDHLVHHGDSEGFYVPVDFPPVIVDERVTGSFIGSSHRLLDECLRLARLLELPDGLDPWSDEVQDAIEGRVTSPSATWQRYGVESFSCLTLIEAARTSIKTGAAIAFG
ncbi:hypothetical protein ACFFHJ_32215 [Planotetraspora thailandica]|nr:hypothetical protein [Planotetraspora thailandica]